MRLPCHITGIIVFMRLRHRETLQSLVIMLL